MPRDAQALKVRPWAEEGDRADPEDMTPVVARSAGWTVDYSQPGGPLVARQLFNQLLREVTGMAVELNTGGAIPEWDAAVDYEHPAFVRHSGTLYISRAASGPATAVAEPAAGSTVWREY